MGLMERLHRAEDGTAAAVIRPSSVLVVDDTAPVGRTVVRRVPRWLEREQARLAAGESAGKEVSI